MPTLGTSNKNKAPLTPRVAGSGTPATPSSGRWQGESARRGAGANDTDPSGPVKAFLGANITPRSSSRKSRVDSGSNTPTGTPNESPSHSRAQSVAETTVGLGLGIQPAGATSNNNVESKPMFFQASEARSALGKPASTVPPASKTSTFFYADGKRESGTTAPIVNSPPVRDERSAMFFHADGRPDIPPARGSSRPTSMISGVAPSRHPTSPGLYGQSPVSPTREVASFFPSLGIVRSPGILNTPATNTPLLSRNQSSQSVPTGPSNSISRPATSQAKHGRASSVGSLDSEQSAKGRGSTLLDTVPSLAGAPGVANLVVHEEVNESAEDETEGTSVVTPQSPIKMAGVDRKQMEDLAANARRERKVMDLEISNSSLLAINRTLEREMRKQTAELRRYRRLSRSGRLSLAPISRQASSGGLSALTEMDSSDEDNDFSDEDPLSDDYDSADASSEDDPEINARRAAKDEARLQIDLAKHQELLTASQQMNQSLKRCLGWTEALIGEGKKALEYKVRVSDVQIGGRVLAFDEQDDEGHDQLPRVAEEGADISPQRPRGGGLLRSSIESEAEDRDSGVDVESSRSARVDAIISDTATRNVGPHVVEI
jgi:hypothetical protein